MTLYPSSDGFETIASILEQVLKTSSTIISLFYGSCACTCLANANRKRKRYWIGDTRASWSVHRNAMMHRRIYTRQSGARACACVLLRPREQTISVCKVRGWSIQRSTGMQKKPTFQTKGIGRLRPNEVVVFLAVPLFACRPASSPLKRASEIRDPIWTDPFHRGFCALHIRRACSSCLFMGVRIFRSETRIRYDKHK